MRIYQTSRNTKRIFVCNTQSLKALLSYNTNNLFRSPIRCFSNHLISSALYNMDIPTTTTRRGIRLTCLILSAVAHRREFLKPARKSDFILDEDDWRAVRIVELDSSWEVLRWDGCLPLWRGSLSAADLTIWIHYLVNKQK